jgi:ATP-dependent Clp protease ATP-binding subunit ClpA
VTQADMNRGSQEAQQAAQQWLSMLQRLAEQIQKQQQNYQQMIQEMMNTYMQLLNTPGSYLSEQAQQQQQTFQQQAQQWMQQIQQQQQSFQQQAQQQQQAFQQMTQEAMNTYMQLFNIPASYAWEGLRTAQRGTSEVPIEGYDELTVAQISERLDELDNEELRRVRDYEARNKNRATLINQIDEKIGTAS